MIARLFRSRTPAHLARIVRPQPTLMHCAYYMAHPHGGWSVEHWGLAHGPNASERFGRIICATEAQCLVAAAQSGRFALRAG